MRRPGQEKLDRDPKMGWLVWQGEEARRSDLAEKDGPFLLADGAFGDACRADCVLRLVVGWLWLVRGERRVIFLYRDRSVWKARG
jgi:hypothetical protein